MDETEAEQLGEVLREALKPYIDDWMKSVKAIFEQNDLIVDHLLRQQNTLALAVANLANGSRPGARVCMNEFEERARELPDKLKGLTNG